MLLLSVIATIISWGWLVSLQHFPDAYFRIQNNRGKVGRYMEGKLIDLCDFWAWRPRNICWLETKHYDILQKMFNPWWSHLWLKKSKAVANQKSFEYSRHFFLVIVLDKVYLWPLTCKNVVWSFCLYYALILSYRITVESI